MTTTASAPNVLPHAAPTAGVLLSAALPLTTLAAHAEPGRALAPVVLLLVALGPVAVLVHGWSGVVGPGPAVARALGLVLAAQVAGLVAGGVVGLGLALSGLDPVLAAGTVVVAVPGLVVARLGSRAPVASR